jgi:hypothetical protein
VSTIRTYFVIWAHLGLAVDLDPTKKYLINTPFIPHFEAMATGLITVNCS